VDEQLRLKARELLLRARIYRFMALIFAMIGVMVFVALYFQHINGDIVSAFHDPSFAYILSIPFLPALVLSILAVKADRQLRKMLEPQTTAKAEKPAKPEKKQKPKKGDTEKKAD